MSDRNQGELISRTELRFVLKILRHRAADYLINLDEHGWAKVDELVLIVNYLFQTQRDWMDWNRVTVQGICKFHNDRLEMENGNIRARYGPVFPM